MAVSWVEVWRLDSQEQVVVDLIRSVMINVNNRKENVKCIEHKYRVGEKVLLEKPGLISKLPAPHTGPNWITHTYNNGTVRVQRGIVNERVNIRRLTPYNERVLPN